jgi:hypothetical protein
MKRMFIKFVGMLLNQGNALAYADVSEDISYAKVDPSSELSCPFS